MSSLGIATQSQVHIGTWTNWSHGKVLGATLTLTDRNGNFLIAFIALFVAFVGGSFFRVVCFFTHLLLSSGRPHDTIHHQRQAVLRNSESGLTAIWAFMKLIWKWRKNGDRPVLRLLPLLAAITITTMAFLVAGVYSNEMNALTGDEVLMTGSSCGVQNFPDNVTVESYLHTFNGFISQRLQSYREYAQDCYTDDGTNQANCKSLARSRLGRSVDTNAACPFDPAICKTNDKNIRLDTGLLDSHYDLGINAPSDERIQFRSVLHCAPLVTQNYSDSFNFSTHGATDPYKRYYYGPFGTHLRQENYTFMQIDNARHRWTAEAFATTRASYDLGQIYYSPGIEGMENFAPIPALARNDTDLMLLFLAANGVLFTNEVNDPWYSAHTYVGNLSLGNIGGIVEAYMADEPASPLGCTMQYQNCVRTAGGQKCSELGQLAQSITIPDLNDAQTKMLQFIDEAALSIYPMQLTLGNLGGKGLVSAYTLQDGIQAPLADNQWQLDVQRWFDISLSAIQGAAVETAGGPTTQDMRQFIQAPTTEQGKYFCRNQKIRSAAHSNFSVLGLSVMFSLGVVIVLIHWSLDTLFNKWLWRYCRSAHYASVDWHCNGVLQLQRLAHEEVGSGQWRDCGVGESVPLAARDVKLAGWDVEDLVHPRLREGLKTGYARGAVEQVKVEKVGKGQDEPVTVGIRASWTGDTAASGK